jgi:regulator of cell morphogenesis and NO signaling
MSRFTGTQSVGEVVAVAPATSRVFERHGIDFCCGGKATLSEACAARRLEVAALVAELESELAERPAERRWADASPGELIEHILATHHVFVKRELPRLDALMDKVHRVHGAAHPETLPEMARLWAQTSNDLAPHLMKEEEILFPAIVALAAGRRSAMPPAWLEGPIGVMEQEHEEVGRLLARMRELAEDYAVPEGACGSWRALWAGLDEFERDLHRHIHLENEVLHPRARALAGL